MSGFLFMDLQSPMHTAGLNNKYFQRNHLDKRAERFGQNLRKIPTVQGAAQDRVNLSVSRGPRNAGRT